MTERDALAEQFEEHRPHLNRVAYRMLGSVSESEDAVQEAWLRLSRADASTVDNLGGWLTTVVARVCLDFLRARRARDGALSEALEIEPVVSVVDAPEEEVLLADSVGVALLVVLEALTPPERIAFVLHDMFAVPFDEIGAILERTPDAARQLASRARRRVRGAAVATDPDLAHQRRLVEAFLAASRAGDFEALVAVLHPDVVFRLRGGSLEPRTVRGAGDVAQTVLARGSRLAHLGRTALVNGAVGVLVGPLESPISVVAFGVSDGQIVSLDVLVAPTLG